MGSGETLCFLMRLEDVSVHVRDVADYGCFVSECFHRAAPQLTRDDAQCFVLGSLKQLDGRLTQPGLPARATVVQPSSTHVGEIELA